MQASPYYTTDVEAASVVYVYDYCIQSWQTAAAFSGNSWIATMHHKTPILLLCCQASHADEAIGMLTAYFEWKLEYNLRHRAYIKIYFTAMVSCNNRDIPRRHRPRNRPIQQL